MAKVLIVDDSLFQRKTIKDALIKEGYEVVEASNGKEGVETAKREKPGMVLLDLVMPDMQGTEVLKQLKEFDPELPLVVVSADYQEATRKECVNLGAVGFVNKPVRGESLETLKNLLKCYIG